MGETTVEIVAAVIAAAALLISWLAWRASDASYRAAIYERRFQIYIAAQGFISAWALYGPPDQAKHSELVGAWDRSHFLFDAKVTAYLWQLRMDANNAEYLLKEHRKDEANSMDAYDKAQRLKNAHIDYDKLRQIFYADLKVPSGRRLLSLA